MNPKDSDIYRRLADRGLTPEQEQRLLSEIESGGRHGLPVKNSREPEYPNDIYAFNDPGLLQDFAIPPESNYALCLKSLDELLERDKLREKDGFPRKIRVGRLIKPGKGDQSKVVVVPTTVEEKFIHDRVKAPDEEEGLGGSGEGEEGEVIGEQPVREADGSGAGPGQGESGPHEMESSAYDLGKLLTEKFELPNLKDKGKKRSLTRYTYDMTDRNRGFGQILDKKATLKKIVETNIHLGNLPDVSDIDPGRFLIAPRDKVYRVLSREKDYESQAIVFFLRDYSGSMSGNPTQLVVSQHVMIYSWLLFQYEKQVESRFILHDTEAKEVPDFYTYYNSRVAGGTRVASAFRLVNEIVEAESLVKDYNIYVFHGTDGDDWDTDGKQTIPEIKQMLTYVNRLGVTIAEHGVGPLNRTEVERYLKASGLLEEKEDIIRLDAMPSDSDETRVIEGIKKLISMEKVSRLSEEF